MNESKAPDAIPPPDPTAGMWLAPGFLQLLSWASCLQAVDRKAQRGPQQVTNQQPVTAPKPASDAASRFLFFSRSHRIPLIANPIAPASYSPTNPHARNVPKAKGRGSDQRGVNSSEDMPAPMCNGLPWLRLGGLVEQEARGGRGWRNSMV